MNIGTEQEVVISGGITLKVMSLSMNGVLDAEAGGMNGEEREYSIFVLSGGRGSKSRTVGHKADMDEGSIHNSWGRCGDSESHVY